MPLETFYTCYILHGLFAYFSLGQVVSVVRTRFGRLTLGTIATQCLVVQVMTLWVRLRAQKLLQGPLLHLFEPCLTIALSCPELTLASSGHPPTLTCYFRLLDRR